MSDQVNPGRAEEREEQASGLLLSVDPIDDGRAPLRAAASDDADTDTTDAGGDTDAGDDSDDSDSGDDAADVDGADEGDLADAGADAGDETGDAMDIVGDNADAGGGKSR